MHPPKCIRGNCAARADRYDAAAASKTASDPKELSMTIRRFGDATTIADMVTHNGVAYLAGHVAEEPVSPSVYEQTKNILKQIDETLAQAKSDKTRMLKVNIWLSDIATFGEMNRAWKEWVPAGQAPARATVEAKLADAKWKVEIMVTAACD
jgi:enamine deaminase RidA (YjgF/YER057c/UK114 family)